MAATHTSPGRTDVTMRRNERARIGLCAGARLVLATALAAVALLGPAGATAHAVPAVWRLVQTPWTDGVAVNDIAAAEPSFAAVAGAGGRVAISMNGGGSWTLRAPSASGFDADLYGIAFRDSTRGVVAGAGGALLVTTDGGITWSVPTFTSEAPTADLNDVAMAGTRVVAVGDGGVVLESASGGASWHDLPAPTTADLESVAVSEEGTIIVGTDGADAFVRRGASWSSAELSAPVTSVAARFPLAGNTSPMTVVASSGYDVVGNATGDAQFSTLLSAIYASEPTWPELTWGSVPSDELLIAGPAGFASFYDVAALEWHAGTTALRHPRAVAATAGQSVAYVLGSDGRVARTLSSARPGATLTPPATTMTAGQTVTFSSTVSIAAPGELVVERRVGEAKWRSVRRAPWTAGGWEGLFASSFAPVFTSEYRLRFLYGGAGPLVSPTAKVIVRPKLKPDALRIVVTRGRTYRFKGSVYPALRNEKVRLYTDRGGKWRRFDLGGVVSLRNGTRWASRPLGTPKRETYHLKARVFATSKHGAAWSPVVTVVVK